MSIKIIELNYTQSDDIFLCEFQLTIKNIKNKQMKQLILCFLLLAGFTAKAQQLSPNFYNQFKAILNTDWETLKGEGLDEDRDSLGLTVYYTSNKNLDGFELTVEYEENKEGNTTSFEKNVYGENKPNPGNAQHFEKIKTELSKLEKEGFKLQNGKNSLYILSGQQEEKSLSVVSLYENRITIRFFKSYILKTVYSNGDIYEGDFRGTTGKTVKGKYTWANGDVYEGDYVGNKRTGKGKLTWANGNVYEGDFVGNKRTGKGKLTSKNGGVYIGEFVDGKFNGKGKLTLKDGKVYEGDFKDGKFLGSANTSTNTTSTPAINTTTKPSGLAGLLWFTTSDPLIRGRYGLMDSITKAVLIKPKYQKVNDFSEGLAAVWGAGLSGGWGYIDKTGKAINSPYDLSGVSNFSEGLAAVAQFNSGLGKKQWGFIDKTGKYVIASQYDEAESFTNGKAKVKKGTQEFFIDKTGNMITDNTTGNANSEGWFVGGQSLFGYKDGNGKVVIQPKYIDVRPFKEGLAAVAVKSSYGTPRWFFVDNAGKEIAQSNSKDIKGNLGYGEVSDFSEGLAAVQGYGGKWGFIDKTGKEVIKLKYENVQSFKDGIAWVEYKGDWGLIDPTEKVLLPFCYNQVISLGEGLYKVKYNYEELKKESKKYDALKEVMSKNSVSGVTKGYILDGGIIDKTGKELKLKKYYQEFRPFSEGLAAVKYSLWGYIDTTGKEVIDGYYLVAGDFKDGKAKVKDEKGREFYIDKTGKEIK